MMRQTIRAAAAVLALALSTTVARADWREDVKVLRIGFIASSGPAADIARLEPFRAYMESRLALPVELVPATSESSLIDAQASARVQYAIDSAAGYASAAALCRCVEPLMLPAALDGSRGFHAILLVRADNPAQTAQDTAGARLALSAADSVAGRLLPLKEFAAAGIDPATHFSALFESPGPVDAVRALLDGRADAALAWSSLAGDAATGYSFGVLTTLVADGTMSMDQVRIVWQSPLIPFGPHAVRSDMPEEEKAAIREALTALSAEAPDVLDAVDPTAYGGGGFVPAAAADYAPLAALVAPEAKDAVPTAP
jgi:phosphonate transport system substrate-binding protein